MGKTDNEVVSLLIVTIFIVGTIFGYHWRNSVIEIEQVKQVEDTYYITINNEIYEYEVEEDAKN